MQDILDIPPDTMRSLLLTRPGVRRIRARLNTAEFDDIRSRMIKRSLAQYHFANPGEFEKDPGLRNQLADKLRRDLRPQMYYIPHGADDAALRPATAGKGARASPGQTAMNRLAEARTQAGAKTGPISGPQNHKTSKPKNSRPPDQPTTASPASADRPEPWQHPTSRAA
jgi:hypothetical protein